jgi:hypothetical protein
MSVFVPWFYRELLGDNEFIDPPDFFKVEILTGEVLFEAVCSLKKNLRPNWVSNSEVYNNRDGSGTSLYKNIAVYKAISEALERWAFYETAESISSKEFCFDIHPTTTGMASYPGLTTKRARENAIMEANERWALHEFWRGNLPIREHFNSIENLRHFEIVTPINNCNVSLLSYSKNGQHLYAFAADKNLEKSFQHALIELARNIRVMAKIDSKSKSLDSFKEISDKRLFYFSTEFGHELFNQKIMSSSKSINVKPTEICDQELKGPWNKYTKVWRYLYANSYPENEDDYSFFMF